MSDESPVTMLVRYVPKPGKGEVLKELVERHGRALRSSGLITDEPVRVWTARDIRSDDEPYFVEMFSWKDGRASERAHETPEIMAIWEPMGEVLEDLGLTQITSWTNARPR